MTTITHSDNPRVMIDNLKGRILDYLAKPASGRMFGHIMVELGLQKGALNRALQELRKAGRIKHAKREWWVTSG